MKKSKSSRSETNSAKKPVSEDFLVVGIGASAGGIQALKKFLENVSAKSDMAYVVILHLSPEHDSQLGTVLQTVAKIPVTQVNERVKVEPNHVYVVSPNRSLKMIDGHIVVEPIKTIEERRAPVDIFFRTLAESHRTRAVAVVLSGTGADGSMGLKRVKERDGVVFVQNPREAEYSDMPRHSIATELVDAVLNAGAIPAKIIAYRDSLGTIELLAAPESRPENQQAALRKIFMELRVRTGHDFSNYKRSTILRRIERRINVHHLESLPAYAALLREEANESQALLKDLLISVTNFFRDREAFNHLEADVVPRMTHGKTAGDQIRVWVAGCATGEEAYSIAMLLAEKTFGKTDAPEIQIFASDIDEVAIAAAREGFYTLNDAADVSPERLRRFFTKEGDCFRVRRELRETILFANHNVIKDPPFSRLDLVTCRNMLIYLNNTAQERVMETFHFALNPGGYLFLGSSESIDGAGDLYAPVSKEHNIFQSRQMTPRPIPVPDLSLPPLRFKLPEENGNQTETEREQENGSGSGLERISFGDLHQQLLERYAPPSIVVNENYDIVHLSERAGRYLRFAGGEPSNNLLNLIQPDLRLELRTALYQAVQKRMNVEASNLPLRIEDRAEIVNLHVRPVLRPEDTARGFILVIFEPLPVTEDEQQRRRGDAPEIVPSVPEPLALHLEEELTRTKAQLRSSIEQFEVQTEELRASNEELQAMNEELRSTAEELETSKEELQSINEELVTVNQELKIKIEEISQSNNDFRNLINSTDIGTVFLDRAFRVKMFTPPAREIFNLIPADLGRPLSDITSCVEHDDLIRDAETVLSKLQSVEREVRAGDGRTLLMQISPYRTSDERIDGVVITLVNITRRKQAEESLVETANSLERQSRIFDTTLSSITDFAYTFDRDGRFVYANRPLLDLLGITFEEISGKNFFDLNYPDDLAARLQRQIQQVFDTRETVRDETQFTSPSGADGFYEYIFNPVVSADGSVEFVVGSTRDVTERKVAEESIRFRAQLLNTVEQSVIATNLDGTVIYWNHFAEKLYGWTAKEATGRAITELTTPQMMAEQAAEVMSELRQGKSWDGEFTVQRRDGATFPAQVINSPISDGEGTLIGVVGVSVDITERKQVEEKVRESEKRYRMLFDSIDEGFCVIEVLFDEASGEAIDCRFLETNPAFDQQTGLTNAAGKTARQLIPNLEERWFEVYGKVALTGETVRFEDESKTMHRWFDIFASRVGNETSRRVAIVFSDITKRKLMEIALREREQFISAVSDASPTLTYIFDVKTRSNLHTNQQVEKLFGYTPEEIKNLGSEFIEQLIHPDDRETARQHFDRCAGAAEGEVLEYEYRFKLKNGAWRWIHSYDTVFQRDARGKAMQIIGVAMDVSESKRAEAALRASEERFRAMFEQANVGIVQLAADGRLLASNPSFCKFIGYSEEETRRLVVRDITHPDDYKSEAELTRRLIAGEIPGYSVEKRYIRKDKGIVWGTMTATLVRDSGGEPIYSLSVIEDISVRKTAEEAVRESEERLRLLVESASDYAIFTVTPDNIVKSWNTGAEKVFGYRESEIVGRSGAVLFTREDLERGVPQQEIETALREGRAEDERWHIRKDGSRFFASGVMRPLRDGKIEGYVKIARDQTERIQAEKALRDKETLQKLVGAQEDERKRIARDLHDHLGQQLTALRLKLEAARKLCGDDQLCAKIDETQALAKRIDDDVDFLAWELRPAALDDLGLIAALDNYVREWSRHSGIPAEFFTSGLGKKRLAPVVETNLYRIAQEALNNVLKHAQAESANVILEKRGSLIILIIEDDGKGFNVEDKANRNKGLGLIGMGERVSLVGGKIQIESTPNKGTTVFVRIPAEEEK